MPNRRRTRDYKHCLLIFRTLCHVCTGNVHYALIGQATNIVEISYLLLSNNIRDPREIRLAFVLRRELAVTLAVIVITFPVNRWVPESGLE